MTTEEIKSKINVSYNERTSTIEVIIGVGYGAFGQNQVTFVCPEGFENKGVNLFIKKVDLPKIVGDFPSEEMHMSLEKHNSVFFEHVENAKTVFANAIKGK